MKNKLYIIAGLAFASMAFVSCKVEEPPFYSGDSRVYFEFVKEGDRIELRDSITKSFIDIEGDTYNVDVRIKCQGPIDFDNDRHYTVRQLDLAPTDPGNEQEGTWAKATAGSDYVALNDAQMVIPKGENEGILSVTIKKSARLGDPINGVAGTGLEIWLELRPNSADTPNDFDFVGNLRENGSLASMRTTYKVKYSNIAEQPSNWAPVWGRSVFGRSWGQVKHAFIIKTLGIIKWENTPPTGMGLYYRSLIRNALVKWNEEHPGNELRELPKPGQEVGTLVTYSDTY